VPAGEVVEEVVVAEEVPQRTLLRRELQPALQERPRTRE